MKTLVVVALLSLAPAALAEVPSPAGWRVDETGCASGGPTWTFFADGTVVQAGCGDDCPTVLEGTWKQDGDALKVRYTKRWFGKGEKVAPGPVPSRTIYESYKGMVEAVDAAETVPWTGPEADGGCQTIGRHAALPGARAALKGAFEAQWPDLSARELSRDELAGKSKKELGLMRNEIYASYGHTFRKAEYRKHFAGVKGYAARFSDVSAFLSPVEHKNVALIKEAEKAAK